MTAPRHLVFRGSVLASAYLVVDTPHARAAVLRRWAPGHELWELDAHRFVWHLPEPERIACDAAPGLPLVALHHRLCGAPFTPAELEGLSPGVTVVEHGAVVVHAPGKAIDVSKWLDVSAFSSAQNVEPLGDPPPPPELVFAPRPKADARATLGFAPLSEEGAAVAEAVRTGQPLPEAPAAPPLEQRPVSIGPVARGLVSGLRRFTQWVDRLFPSRPAPAPGPSTSTALAAPPRPGLFARLDAWLARMLENTRIAQVIGQRQADYVSRLMQMFEQGDLDAALKHAIPLAGRQVPANPQPSLLSPLGPRANLDIPLRPHAPAGSTVALGDSYEQLRRRYRAAAEKLEAEGRYKEAAFVLSELLQADEEAITLLEKHRLYELAAELAEARQLAPGIQVRQWFLAKNVARAIAVARRHGVFGDAVARLSRSKHDAEARQLRLHWADAQASSGDFYNAVVTLWALEDARPLARRWLELGIAQGGLQATRLEVKRLALDAEKGDPSRLLAVLDSDDPERAAERALIAAELQVHGAELKAHAKPLARAAIRTVLRDANGAVSPELTRLAADGALKADLPLHRQPEPKLNARTPPLRLDVQPFDRGALPVHDAAMLPDGRMLLGLGEAGVRLVTRDGRTAKHFDAPATSLVPYDHGGRALCLAWRGEVLVAARLDVLEGRIEPLPQQRLVTWADGTDGSMWFVYDGAALCGLDLHDPKLPALWRTPMPGLYGRPARNAQSLTVVPSPAPGDLEWWRYELPSLTLRVRQQLALPQVNERVRVMADGNMCITQGGVAWQQQHTGAARRQLTGLAGGVIVDVEGAGEWFSLVTRSEGGLRWMLVDLAGVTVRHVVQLPRTQGFSVRMNPSVAVYSDHDGRVLAVDLVSGRLLRDLRVR